jgi:soluble cytochrome b562
MPRNFRGNDALRTRITACRSETLERMRAAATALDQENRDLQAVVGTFQNSIGDLRSVFEELAGSMNDYRASLSKIQTGPLRRAAGKLGDVADTWQVRISKDAA